MSDAEGASGRDETYPNQFDAFIVYRIPWTNDAPVRNPVQTNMNHDENKTWEKKKTAIVLCTGVKESRRHKALVKYSMPTDEFCKEAHWA